MIFVVFDVERKEIIFLKKKALEVNQRTKNYEKPLNCSINIKFRRRSFHFLGKQKTKRHNA